MKILKAQRNVIDVFRGEGWANWSRYRLIKSPKGTRIIFVGGVKLKHSLMNQLEKTI